MSDALETAPYLPISGA